MSEYSTTAPSMGPRSPIFGTATFSTLSPTSQTPMSPSRFSSSVRSDTPIASSYDSDDASSQRQMRRIIVSPSPTFRDTDSFTYSDDYSMREVAEVEASLSAIDNQLDDVQDMLSEFSHGSSNGQSTYTSYTGPSMYTSHTGPSTFTSHTGTGSGSGSSDSYPSFGIQSAVEALLDRAPRLSTISERTENTRSRPTSHSLSGGSRPNTQHSPGDAKRSSANLDSKPLPSLHTRSSTEPNRVVYNGARALPPTPVVGKVVEKIAFFEDRDRNATIDTPHKPGHSRTASAPSGPRSPSPYATAPSQSIPAVSSSGYGYGTTTGHGSQSSLTPYSGASTAMSSMLSPPPHTSTSAASYSRVSPSTAATSYPPKTETYTGSATNSETYTGTHSNSNTLTMTSLNTLTATRSSSQTPRALSPSEDTTVSQVKNIMKRWKERTPSMGKTVGTGSSASPPRTEGLFSIRRRASRGKRAQQTPPRQQSGTRNNSRTAPEAESTSGDGTLSTSGLLPPPFDLAQLGMYAGASESQEVSVCLFIYSFAYPIGDLLLDDTIEH
ncbi:hypothetical protein WOLCODRAFT_158153 [Wolfiporia cocos MD-104 SS10]|uniref:Uncharacterized protein n=1 Tax=Wolfiporia cocos (strain MD-104) TaxID=742152 RepID=A0A2H3JCA0_WOLCO|nr:hypothetical protein WOLCODRAFT_158153 [Wolfiporia cocos MD-104 SS10]